jgi:hypothetical protein
VRPSDSAEVVSGKLQRYSVVVLTGARGTAKHAVCDAVVSSRSPEYACSRIDVSQVRSLGELNQWLCCSLGLSSGDMPRPADLHDLTTPILFVLERLDRLHGQPWLDAWQDTWRALFSSPEVKGSIALLLSGRPLIRSALGGRGSPLLNIAADCRVAPLAAADVEQNGKTTEAVVRVVCRKTGGHPQSTMEILDLLDGELTRLGRITAEYVHDRHRFLMGLVDDHGELGRQILGELMHVRGGRAAEVVLRRRRLTDGNSRPIEPLEDLISSGLIGRDEAGAAYVSAAMLKVPSLMQYLTADSAAHQPMPRQPDDHATASRLIYEFENILRAKVQALLSSTDASWWTSRVQDKKAVAEAELRRADERDSVVAPDEELGLLSYLDLRQVAAIVQQKDNWHEFFALGLHLKGEPMAERDFADAIEDIALVRNKVAHSRPVSGRDVDRLRRAGRVLGFPMS